MKKPLLPTLVVSTLVSVLALSGCGGGGSSSSSSASASAAAPASSGAATPSASSSASADTTPSASSAGVSDPCTVLSVAQVSRLTGVSLKSGTASDVGTSKLCTWVPKDPSDADSAIFTAQEGPAQGSDLSEAEGPLKKQFGGTVSKTTVKGADDARYITGKVSSANVVDVLAKRGDVFYQVIAATPKDAKDHKDGVYAIVEALVAA